MKRGAWIGMTALGLSPLGLAACTHDPMAYIPSDERTLLQAQARLGATDNAGPSVSVQEMLERARAQQGQPTATQAAASVTAVAPGRVVVQFAGDTVALDTAQRQSLDRLAAAAGSGQVVVTGQKGSFDGATPLLGQRRAVAVAKALEASVPNVDVRFVSGIPDNLVVVTTAQAGRQETQP